MDKDKDKCYIIKLCLNIWVRLFDSFDLGAIWMSVSPNLRLILDPNFQMHTYYIVGSKYKPKYLRNTICPVKPKKWQNLWFPKITIVGNTINFSLTQSLFIAIPHPFISSANCSFLLPILQITSQPFSLAVASKHHVSRAWIREGNPTFNSKSFLVLTHVCNMFVATIRPPKLQSWKWVRSLGVQFSRRSCHNFNKPNLFNISTKLQFCWVFPVFHVKFPSSILKKSQHYFGSSNDVWD